MLNPNTQMKTARGLSVVEGSLAEDKAGLSLPTTGRPGCELSRTWRFGTCSLEPQEAAGG